MLLGPVVLLLRAPGIATNLQFLNAEKEAGGQRMTSRRWPTKLVMSWEAVRDV